MDQQRKSPTGRHDLHRDEDRHPQIVARCGGRDSGGVRASARRAGRSRGTRDDFYRAQRGMLEDPEKWQSVIPAFGVNNRPRIYALVVDIGSVTAPRAS